MKRTREQYLKAADAINRLAKKAATARKMKLVGHANIFRQIAKMKRLQAERAESGEHG